MEKIWKRGDIFYIENTNAETTTGRPAVIVSSEKTYDSNLVQVVYLTTQPKEEMPTHIDIAGTQRTSVALCEQIRTVPVGRLGDFICSCTDYEMQMIDIALAIGLDLDFENTVKDNVSKNEDLGAKVAKNDNNIKENVAKSAESDNKADEIIIKLTAERDTYKQLYETMLERMMK